MMDRELHMQTAIVGLAQAAFSRISEWISVSCIVARATALYCLAAVVWGICITPRVLYNLSRILCPCRSPLQNFNFIYDLYTPYSIYRPKWTGFILLFYLARHQVFSGSYTSDSLPRATSYTIRLSLAGDRDEVYVQFTKWGIDYGKYPREQSLTEDEQHVQPTACVCLSGEILFYCGSMWNTRTWRQFALTYGYVVRSKPLQHGSLFSFRVRSSGVWVSINCFAKCWLNSNKCWYPSWTGRYMYKSRLHRKFFGHTCVN